MEPSCVSIWEKHRSARVTVLSGTLEENALSVTVAPAELEKALAVLHKTLILPQYEEG